jgi:hypothetical protein
VLCFRSFTAHCLLPFLPPACQASIGLGFHLLPLAKELPVRIFPRATSLLSSKDRFAVSFRAASVSGTASMPFACQMPLTRTASTGGLAGTRERTCSKQGEKRTESNRLPKARLNRQSKFENVDNPEEEIESLCKLLTTVGGLLDSQKARVHMDVYFSVDKEPSSYGTYAIYAPSM